MARLPSTNLAFISTQVYRDAWPHGRAPALPRDGAGGTFDAGCAQECGADLAVAA